MQYIKSLDLPLLILGGGGYNRSNTAICWTSIQAAILDQWPLPDELPEHEYFDEYGPSYHMKVNEAKMRDCNSDYYLESLIDHCKRITSKLSQN